MTSRRAGWLSVSLTLLVLTTAGCHVSTGHCDEDAGCGSFGGGDGDAGAEMDGSSDAGDAGLDAGGQDSGPNGAMADAGSDAGDPDKGDPLTVGEFCQAALAPALAWIAKVEDLGCCSSAAMGSDEYRRVLSLLGYPSAGVSACEAQADNPNVTFDGAYAKACADALAANYKVDPPSACPTGEGFFVVEIEATVGHGLQKAAQIPACRKTFAGKLAAEATCSADIDCADGRVCRPAPGGLDACLPPVKVGGSCSTKGNDCAFGTICLGYEPQGGMDTTGGPTCVDVTDLGINGANCSASVQCAEGLICSGASHQCESPSPAADFSATGDPCMSFQCQGFCNTNTQQCEALCAQ